MSLFAAVLTIADPGDSDHHICFGADGDTVTISFPNVRVGLDIIQPENGFDVAEAIDEASTIKVSLAQFEGAMGGFIAQLHALRSIPIDQQPRARFSLHRCEQAIDDHGTKCARQKGHAGPCSVVPR